MIAEMPSAEKGARAQREMRNEDVATTGMWTPAVESITSLLNVQLIWKLHHRVKLFRA
jgi:hypothetical protein